MTNPYVAVLRAPRAWRFSAAGFVARLPISMLGIGTVLLVENATGSYALAGAVAATLAIAAAAGGPLIARFVDRFGQRRVGLPSLVLHVAGLVGLVVAAEANAPAVLLFVTAAVAGAFQPAIGSFVRARWAVLFSGTDRLRTAYSLEAVVDELIFITGPPLVAVLAVTVGADWALLATAVIVGVGTLLLLAQRRTEPQPQRHATHAGSALRQTGMPMCVLVAFALGGIFGSVEITVVAFADELGQQAAAGLVLAVYAAGSMLAGLAYGVIHPRAPLRVQYVLGCTAMMIVAFPLPFADSIAVLTALIFVAGFAISPTLISGIALVEELVPASMLTEGLTWETTGIAAGVAAGASLSGPVVDASGASAAFWVTVGFSVAAAAMALLAQPSLRRAADSAHGRALPA